MSTSATPSPHYSLPPARIPVPSTFAGDSEVSPSPRPLSRDASPSNTQTPSSELRAYTPRIAMYTPDAPHMSTMRLQSLTPPAALAAYLSTPSPARRLGVFTPSRMESRSRGVSEEGGGHERRVGLGDDQVDQAVFGDTDLDYYEPLGGGSDNDSIASGRLSTVAEGLSDREDSDETEEMGVNENIVPPAVSPQADHPTLDRGQSQAPEGVTRHELAREGEDGSDTSSVRSRLSSVAEGLSDEERDVDLVEDYLMQSDDRSFRRADERSGREVA